MSEREQSGRDSRWRQVATALLCAGVSGAAAGLAFVLHFNLSTAGSIQMLLVVVAALRFGFGRATVVSITGVACLNYLFTAPLFQFTVSDAQNWVSLTTFEATALLVSGLSAKVRLNVRRADLKTRQSTTLFELSRAILLIDTLSSTLDQLSGLLREMLEVETVDLWVIYDEARPGRQGVFDASPARTVYELGLDSDDLEQRTTRRVLRLGTTPIGGMVLAGWEMDALLADAVASLAAIAVERRHAIERENRAEAERKTEQLRTAVLDGLAHGFKTPLTAIQTASSGLLAIDRLSETQKELVSIIDERATMLAQLTTRLLQTAALESVEVRMRRTHESALSVVEAVLAEETEETRERIVVSAPAGLVAYQMDPHLMGLAVGQLIDNAVKYSGIERAIRVEISQSLEETRIVVANAGSTIRVEERERIFERFYRGKDAVHGPSGTGLGLSIVRKIAEAHGGRVWVEGGEDEVRFVLMIPNYMGPGSSKGSRHGE